MHVAVVLHLLFNLDNGHNLTPELSAAAAMNLIDVCNEQGAVPLWLVINTSVSKMHSVEVSVVCKGLHERIRTVRTLQTQCRGLNCARDCTEGSGQSMGLCSVKGTAWEDPDSQIYCSTMCTVLFLRT